VVAKLAKRSYAPKCLDRILFAWYVPVMPDLPKENSIPQFGTAEYVGTPSTGGDQCKVCLQTVSGEYYRLEGKIVCSRCAQKAQQEMPKDSERAYLQGLLYGIGAALAGLIGYAAVVITLQGWVFSYFSFAVGWFVAKAMMAGSKGAGGRRYQIAAVLLTYAAISIAIVPIGIWQLRHNRLRPPARASQQRTGSPRIQAPVGEPSASSNHPPSARPAPRTGIIVARLVVLGLTSPFQNLASFFGILNLFILFVGLRIAWQLTAGPRFLFNGPFPC